jgi:hypothetical protein
VDPPTQRTAKTEDFDCYVAHQRALRNEVQVSDGADWIVVGAPRRRDPTRRFSSDAEISSKLRMWSRLCRPDINVAAPRVTDRCGKRFNSDVSSGMGSVNHLAIANVDADMGNVGSATAEKDQIARLKC